MRKHITVAIFMALLAGVFWGCSKTEEQCDNQTICSELCSTAISRNKLDKAVPFCKKGCELENGSCCAVLSVMYEDDVKSKEANLSKDSRKAIEFAEKACIYGVVQSCLQAGEYYLKHDERKAVKYFRKGCQLGNTDSCQEYNLALVTIRN